MRVVLFGGNGSLGVEWGIVMVGGNGGLFFFRINFEGVWERI